MNTKVKSLALVAASGVALALLSTAPASAAPSAGVTAITVTNDSTVSHITFKQPANANAVAYTYQYKLYTTTVGNAQPVVAITAAPNADGVISFDVTNVCTAVDTTVTPNTCTTWQDLLANGGHYRIQIGSLAATTGATWTWSGTAGNIYVFATGTPSAPIISAGPADGAIHLLAVDWTGAAVTPANGGFTGYEYTTDGGTTWAALAWDGTTLPLPVTTESTVGAAVLVNGTAYHFAIRGVNGNGSGAPSHTVDVTPALVGDPSAPVVSAVRGAVGGTIVVHLDTVSAPVGAATLAGYQWSVSPDCTVWSSTVTADVNGEFVVTVTGGSSTALCVRGIDSDGRTSAASAPTSSVTTLTLCSSVAQPTLVYSATSKNLTPAGRRVLNRYITALGASDCAHVSFNTVVRYAPKSVSYTRAQKRLAVTRNNIVSAYLADHGVTQHVISSYTTTLKLKSANRTSFSATSAS